MNSVRAIEGNSRACLNLGNNSHIACYHLSVKEVIQPHLPVGLPCYDLVPVISLTLGASLLAVG